MRATSVTFIRSRQIVRVVSLLFATLQMDPSFAKSQAGVSVGPFFESNAFYLDQGERADGSLRVAPFWKYEADPDGESLQAEVKGSYNKYLQYANQDYFDYGGSFLAPLNPDGKWTFYLGGGGEKVSEPALYFKKVTLIEGNSLLPTRNERHEYNGMAGVRYRWTSLSTFRVSAQYIGQAYDDKYHQYMNNNIFKGTGFYDYQFLPETMFFIGGSVGAQIYPNGRKNASNFLRQSEVKNSSQFIEGRMGVKGRLAERTRVDASGAIQVRVYERESSFSEPVFNLKIEEQFSPKDLLIAGYDYEINDSKWTNFVVDQTTFIGYARILGDQVLALSRLNYTYSSYSRPVRREDQRLSGEFKVDYSMSPRLLLTGTFELDILNSDQRNAVDFNQLPDKPLSYEAFKAGLLLTAFF